MRSHLSTDAASVPEYNPAPHVADLSETGHHHPAGRDCRHLVEAVYGERPTVR
ncbi:MAG: hypothetical protein M5R40_06720 [Anaerolineae bacterium]|nr:hypothetical protein [Anaerolineae bacterium]